jgi:hypothetical protein
MSVSEVIWSTKLKMRSLRSNKVQQAYMSKRYWQWLVTLDILIIIPINSNRPQGNLAFQAHQSKCNICTTAVLHHFIPKLWQLRGYKETPLKGIKAELNSPRIMQQCTEVRGIIIRFLAQSMMIFENIWKALWFLPSMPIQLHPNTLQQEASEIWILLNKNNIMLQRLRNHSISTHHILSMKSVAYIFPK